MLQVVKLSRDLEGRGQSNLSVGKSSEENQTEKDEHISFFSPNIKLTFFPPLHKNA